MTAATPSLPELLAIIARDLTAKCQRCGGKGDLGAPDDPVNMAQCPDCSGTGVTHPFRKRCPCTVEEIRLYGHPEAVCKYCKVEEHSDKCLECFGKTYVPREPHELPVVLQACGWMVVKGYYPDMRCTVTVRNSRGLLHGASDIDADLALAQAVVSALEGAK